MSNFGRTIWGLAASTIATAAMAGDVGDKIVATGGEARLTTAVKTALLADTDVKGTQINVASHADRVQLNGFVDSPDDRAEAERIAGDIAGPGKVANNLSVRSGDRTATEVASDAALATRVKAALGSDARTSAHRVDVSVYQDVVSLGGFVPAESERLAAEEVARSIENVVTVQNGIEVTSN